MSFSKQNRNLRITALSFLVLFHLNVSVAKAADAMTSDSRSYVPQLTVPNTILNLTQPQGVNFNGCDASAGNGTSVLGNAINNIVQAAGSGAAMNKGNSLMGAIGGIESALQGVQMTGYGADCAGGDQPPREDLSCRKWQADLAAYQNHNRQIASALSCRMGKLSSIASEQGELRCLRDQSAMLRSQLDYLKNESVREFGRFNQDVASFKQAQQVRKDQKETAMKRLNGDPETQRPGLIQVREELKNMQGMAEDHVTQVEVSKRQIEAQEKAIKELEDSRIGSSAGKCFATRTSTGYRCAPNGPPVSAQEYLLCRYEQNHHLNNKGVFIRGKETSTNDEAIAARQGLQGVLAKIFGDMPTQQRLPRTGGGEAEGESVESFSEQSMAVTSLEDLDAQYGDQLRGLNAKGIDVYAFVMNEMENCFTRAKTQVRKERERSTTELGTQIKSLKDLRDANRNQMNKYLVSYKQTWTKMISTLRGDDRPKLDTSLCQNLDNPDPSIACIKSFRTRLDDWLNGAEGTGSWHTIEGRSVAFQGKSIKSGVTFYCASVNNCIESYTKAVTEFQREADHLEAKKGEYVQQANQSFDTFIEGVKPMLNAQAQALDARISKVNAVLGSLGVKSLIDVDPVEAEEKIKNDDGLYEVPNDMVKFVGGQLKPGLKDLDSSALSSVYSAIGETVNDAKSKIAEAASANQSLIAAAERCQEDAAEKAANGFQAKLEDWISKCRGSEKCRRGEDPLSEVSNIMAEIDSSNASPELASILDSGFLGDGACYPSDALNYSDDMALKKSLQTQIDNWQGQMSRAEKRESESGTSEEVADADVPGAEQTDGEEAKPSKIKKDSGNSYGAAYYQKKIDEAEDKIAAIDAKYLEKGSSQTIIGEGLGDTSRCDAIASQLEMKARDIARANNGGSRVQSGDH